MSDVRQLSNADQRFHLAARTGSCDVCGPSSDAFILFGSCNETVQRLLAPPPSPFPPPFLSSLHPPFDHFSGVRCFNMYLLYLLLLSLLFANVVFLSCDREGKERKRAMYQTERRHLPTISCLVTACESLHDHQMFFFCFILCNLTLTSL